MNCSQADSSDDADLDLAQDDNQDADPVSTSASLDPETPATRVTRVARHEAIPPLDIRPRAPAPTETQQADRVTALQNQIRYTFAIQPNVLRRHLRNNNWNVIEAADAFWEEEETARNRTTVTRGFYDLPMARSVETSRLHARTALRRRLNASIQSNNPRQLRNTALLGLLQRNHWVVDDAVADFRANGSDIQDITDAYSRLRTPRPSVMEQDARLAAFISLTSTNSIYGARRHLESYGWDYARAVDGWRRLRNIPEDRAPKRISQKGFVHETEPNDGLRYHNANHPPYSHSDWKDALDAPEDDERSTIASPSSDNASDSSLGEADSDSDASEKLTYDDSKHRGYLIEYDRRPAVVNCPDPSKLRVEMISKGKYKMALFKGQEERPLNSTTLRRKFRWHDEERDDENDSYVEFDWANNDHIHQLNDWRQQFSRRQTAVTVKSRSVPYHQLEEDFLWQKHAEHLEEEVGKNNVDPNDGNSFPLRVSHARKVEWTNTLNNKFAGQTDVDGVHISDEPRPVRLPSAIGMARSRMQSIIDDFGVNFVARHGPEQGRAKKPKGGKKVMSVQFESGSESDDDDEIAESSGGEDSDHGGSSDSYEGVNSTKRKRKDKGKVKAVQSKRRRGGPGGGYTKD